MAVSPMAIDVAVAIFDRAALGGAAGDLDADHPEQRHRQHVGPDDAGNVAVLGAEGDVEERPGEQCGDGGDRQSGGGRQGVRRGCGEPPVATDRRQQHQRDRRRGEECRPADRREHGEAGCFAVVEDAVGDEQVDRLHDGEEDERHAEVGRRAESRPASPTREVAAAAKRRTR